jgi:hypothetical protein
VSASYGLNCPPERAYPAPANSPALGNATTQIHRLCRFSTVCEVQVNVRWLGDPVPGCAKDFDVAYQCGDGPGIMTGHIQGEANGQSIVLKCPVQTTDEGM